MADLKPCPFCGGEAEPFNPFDNADGTWCVLCSECASATGFEQTEAEAIAAWNTRVLHSTLTADQVREAVLKRGNVMGPRFYGDWQAIADELNAAWNSRAERTCHNLDKHYNIMFKCSECGHWECQDFDGEKMLPQTWNYCPNCGCKVIGG